MSCEMPAVVADYIEQVEHGKWRTCRYQKALCKLIRKTFETEDLIVDAEKLDKYLGLAKYMAYGELFPWEKFLTALWLCTYRAPGVPRWPTIFDFVGRGAGKDGFIAYLGLCMVSPYNSAKDYDVDICANNEEQATTPVLDIVEALEIPEQAEKLKKFYYHTKERVQGKKNRGKIRGRTNNPKGKDGMRSGVVIFNEVHAYENYKNIDVFTTGLGKKDEPRRGYFTSNGDVDDGPFDDLKETADRILFEGEPDNGFLPFVCCLDSETEVDDPANWYKANPSLQYRPALLTEIETEYKDWKRHPERNGSFMTKRMGLRRGQAEIAVTSKEKIMQTKKERPDTTGWACVVGIDYAEFSDWASVVAHFRRGEERIDIHHSWLCLQSQTLHRVRAPWQEWAARGFITPVDAPSINPDLIGQYISNLAGEYQVKQIILDHFRYTAMSETLAKIGFDAKDKNRLRLIRPGDIMQIEPVIQSCFDNDYLNWGDDPVMRWACNNTKRVRSSRKAGSDTGNFYYAKIEAKSRKTDPFMAYVAAMIGESALNTNATISAPLPAFRL